MINNPVGIGFFVMLLLLSGVVLLMINYQAFLDPKEPWKLIALLWLLIAFIGVQGARLPIQFVAFRWWMIFVIPVAILTAYSVRILLSLRHTNFWIALGLLEIFVLWYNALSQALQAAGRGNFYILGWPLAILLIPGCVVVGMIIQYAFKQVNIHFNQQKTILIIVLLSLLFVSSFSQKWAVNTTSGWPFGVAWTSMEEVQGYVQLRQLGQNIPIFTLTDSGDSWVIGFDQYNCAWCKDEIDFKKTAINQTPQVIHDFVKSKNYQYLIIDGVTAKKYGINETNVLVQNLAASGLFGGVYQNNGMILLRVL